MSRAHDLSNVIPSLTVKVQTLKRVRTFRLLGTWLNENLKWTDHVKELVSPCLKVLSILRKIRDMAPQQVKKQLVESLIISKLDYNNIFCYPNCRRHSYRRKFNWFVTRLQALRGTMTPPSKTSLIQVGSRTLRGRNSTSSNLLTVRYMRIPAGPNICLCHYTTLKGTYDLVIHYK